ncbi:MAG: SiaC family regulatory phosphoprotein [Ekhidna sp.]|uniref:SiaC family regulatory phosphoprotein n=1 Tax=Ekhidna sp. TaxID=2608089 RepID=UPI0032EF5C70
MNAQVAFMDQQQEVSPLRVVKAISKIFNIRYMENLNLMMVTGWSITDDAWIKYCQMLADIESHLRVREELNIYFKFELFNTSSAKYLFKIIKRLNKAHKEGKMVKIYWSCSASEHENEMIESGLDFASMSDFQFKISLN